MNCFVDGLSVFDHMQRARFSDEAGVKFGIFASEIEFAQDGGGRNLVLVGGGIFVVAGLGEIEGKNEGGGGWNYEAHYNFHKAPLVPDLPLIPPVDSRLSGQ